MLHKSFDSLLVYNIAHHLVLTVPEAFRQSLRLPWPGTACGPHNALKSRFESGHQWLSLAGIRFDGFDRWFGYGVSPAR